MSQPNEFQIPSRSLKRPKLAEMVAANLREQIVSGNLAGGALPSIERLMQLFDVSAPVVRESLRILEHEGLITVRRGQLGGAIVHRPSPGQAAYSLGIVLQSQSTPIADVSLALRNLEPLCARLVAQRPDRHSTVLPALQATNEEMKAAIYDEGARFVKLASRFHHQLVTGCGNNSIALVAWSLEWLWDSQPEIQKRQLKPDLRPVDFELRHTGVAAHDAIISAIEDGEATLAENHVRGHIEHPEAYGDDETTAAEPVRATHLRGDLAARDFENLVAEHLRRGPTAQHLRQASTAHKGDAERA